MQCNDFLLSLLPQSQETGHSRHASAGDPKQFIPKAKDRNPARASGNLGSVKYEVCLPYAVMGLEAAYSIGNCWILSPNRLDAMLQALQRLVYHVSSCCHISPFQDAVLCSNEELPRWRKSKTKTPDPGRTMDRINRNGSRCTGFMVNLKLCDR